jgi:two-component system, chemotaxis family, sensor kinase CheA
MANDVELLQEYVAESKEHLERVEKIFLDIEKMNGRVHDGALHDLFRAIHTIKGSAGFLGLTSVGKLTHAMESLLAALRDKVCCMSEGVLESLIEGLDHLNHMFSDIGNSNTVEVHGVETKLRAHLQADDDEKPAMVSCPSPQVQLDSTDLSTPTQEDSTDSKEVVAASSEAQDYLRIRVDMLDRLMMLAGELVLVRNQQLMRVDQGDPMLRTVTQRLDAVTTELQETIMRTRMQPIGNVFSRFHRLARDLGRKLDKKIELDISGGEVELDKNILDALVDPLTHLVRNSCDHGVEGIMERLDMGKPAAGRISLSAYHESGQIHVDIADDGKGMSREAIRRKVLEKKMKSEEELARLSDADLLNLVFLPGFSTAAQVTDVSGRGVGMDVVKTGIERFGGTIEIQSFEGKGTAIKLRLPLTLAIIPSLLVQSGDERFAIPQVNLEELVCLYDDEVLSKIECAGSREVFRLRDTLLPMVRLHEALSRSEPFDEESLSAVTERKLAERQQQQGELQKVREKGGACSLSLNFAVVRSGNTRFGLIIDRIHGTEEIVVKPMHRAVKGLSVYSGATVLGDGKVAMILDVMGLAKHCAVQNVGIAQEVETHKDDIAKNAEDIRSLLLFTNGGAEQFAVPMQTIKRIERVERASIENVGSQEYLTIDGISTRVVRLDECLPVSVGGRGESMYMLLPQQARKPYGVLVEHIVDSGHYTISLNKASFQAHGVEGTAIVKQKMTLLLEPETMVSTFDKGWYHL